MWWLDRVTVLFPLRLVAACSLAATLGGCIFQPMYAQTPLFGTGPSLRDAMRDVEVTSINGRIGNEIRNDLIFELTGGAGNPVGAPYRLTMLVNVSTTTPIIEATSGRPQASIIFFDVTYKLQDVAKDRIVLTEKALGRASFDSSQQRFANARAVRDAQNRASKVVAEQIRARLASFFLTRT